MARRVIHTGSFLSRSGVVWRVDIWEEGFPDGIVPVPGELDFPADEPLVIEWDEKDKEEVVCGSSCTLRIISPGDRTYAGLYATEVAAIGVNIYRDGELHWTGTLDPCQYEEPYERAWGYDVMLTFTDFGVLDRLRYNLKGLQKMSDVLTDALTRAGLSAASVDYSSLISSLHVPVTGSTPSAYDGAPTGGNQVIWNDNGSGILLPDSYVPPALDDNTDATEPATPDTLAVLSDNFYDDDDEGKTLLEVVEAMLQPMGMRMVQRGGTVWVYDLNAVALAAGDLSPREVPFEPTYTITARRRILSDGTIATGSSWSYTSPIRLLAGDRLAVTCSGYNSNAVAVLSLTDQNASFYSMIYDGTGQPAQGTAIERVYTAVSDCWVAVSYVTGKGCTISISHLRPIHWTGDSQTLSADKAVSSIKVTFSPNGGGELMTEDDLEYGLEASPTDINYAGNGNRQTYHSDYDSTDSTDASFTAHHGKGSGMASVVDSVGSYFKIVPQFSGQEAEGIIAWYYKGGSGSHHYQFQHDPPPDEIDKSTAGILFRTRRVYVPPVDNAGAGIAYMLRLTQELLLDPRYNPFEEAVGDNEGGRYDDWKKFANYVYVAADLILWDSETGGNALYYYSNRKAASHGETKSSTDHSYDESDCGLGNHIGSWEAGSAPSTRNDARCWLSWYDQSAYDTRKDSCGILGWKGNRHNIGIARGNLKRDLREVPDGEYIPYPPCGGWLEVSVWGGIFVYDKIGEIDYDTPVMLGSSDTTTTGVMSGGDVSGGHLSTVGIRWCLFKHPRLEIVENGVKREVPDPDDEELTAWTSATAGEELSIDTKCGVLEQPVPNARGQIYHVGDGTAAPLRSIERGGRRARPEELLCGTLYSQYAERHTVLSGEASITPGGIRTFTDANQSGKYFMLAGESQNCIEDTTEAAYVELSADSWDSSIYDREAQQTNTFEAKTRKVKRK